MRDRLNINLNFRDSMINEWIDKKVLGIDMLETKDIFLLAAALGIDSPKDICGKKDGYVRLSYIKTYQKALMASILLGKEGNEEHVDIYANEDINYDEAERCAESGFEKLNDLINSVNGDMELLEKRMFSQLNILYQKNVASNL